MDAVSNPSIARRVSRLDVYECAQGSVCLREYTVCTHTHARIHRNCSMCTHACMRVCMCVCVKMHACKYVRMYVRTYGLRMYTNTRIHAQVNLDKSVYWRLAAAGAICASIGHGLLVPLDTVKTRMQTAPPGKYENTMDAFVKVLRDEGGGAALLRGLQPEVVGFAVYGAFSFGGTEFCRRWVADLAGPQGSILYQIPILMLGSAMASVVAIAATCPFMAIKTRLIADESFAGGDMIKGFRRVIDEEEWQASLFGGLLPLMLKDVLFVLSKFVVFDIVKTALFLSFPEARDSLSASLAVSLVSGSFAGMVSAVTSQPGDYLFSKSAQTKEASLGSAWATYWDDGVKRGKWADLLTGLPARIVFSGALIAIQFVIYDYLRVQFHVSPNELLEFLDVMATVPTTAT